MERGAAAGVENDEELLGMKSLVNLKRNLRSVISAYGFAPVGMAEPATGRFRACLEEDSQKGTKDTGFGGYRHSMDQLDQ